MVGHGVALDVGILILRVTVGVTLAAHGYQKFFGAGGITAVATWFDSIGMRPGRLNAVAAATTELGAGLLLALGFLTPVAAAAFVALMLVAVWSALRHKGFFASKGGWEYNLVLAVAAISVGGSGAGRVSLDDALFRHSSHADVLYGWSGLVFAVVVGVVAGVIQLAIFYRPPAPSVGA